jgi:quinol monooxygenase YgiN
MVMTYEVPMTTLFGTARLKVREGKLEEFKRLVAVCMEIARTKDSGTLEYEMFASEDFTEFMMHERYRDSEAALEHSANQGPDMMKAMLETCTIVGEVCGSPGPQLRKALQDAGVKLYTPFMSMTDPPR